MKNCNGTLIFESKPRISSFASVAGKKESEGPLHKAFDMTEPDPRFGQKTFEQAESRMMRLTIEKAMEKRGVTDKDIDIALCGDLLNQCVASGFAVRGLSTPYAGIYGACSTMALGLILSSIAVESGAARRAVCAASSHFCTAERQYRTPLEYGAQRTPTAQRTVTGCGACIIEPKSSTGFGSASYPNSDPPYIDSARIGIVTDYAVSDQSNMGAAMAPAAADTIYRYLSSTGTKARDYDAIFTGDLGVVGSRLLYDLLAERNIDIEKLHRDCGMMIYGREQDVHAGGSGCGCCASVLCSHILNALQIKAYRNILFIATGAMLSPTTVMQNETIPSIAHLVNIRVE